MSVPAIPLALKLRKKLHRDVAAAQDLLVLQVYASFPESVLHGGTAIWRCYRGNRFSEDIDAFIPHQEARRLEAFVRGLRARGLVPVKFKETQNSVYVKFAYAGAEVRFEAVTEARKEYVVRQYEMLDGSFMLVRTLSPEDLILEKIAAYRGRRKVRDLYDIYFLVNSVEKRDKVAGRLREFLGEAGRPVDENILRAVIMMGTAPAVDDMMEAISGWAR